ncbi:hypothetical protein Q5P01_005189 [Channa striata]|uniref:Uncharacterized protein n=1 Tax=Channa striata TaxID=64152 RepID=A0AA88NCE1_CHASR|nr:hypothetical protein Q5P01_005189 [Channa striata]
MSKDKVHLVRFVLDGEIVDSKTEGARTPFISSMLLPGEQTRCEFAGLLLRRGASGVNGRSPLRYACERGSLVVKILIRNKQTQRLWAAGGKRDRGATLEKWSWREGGRSVVGVSLQTYIISAQPPAATTEMETTALRE